MIGKNNWRIPSTSQSKETGLTSEAKKKGSQIQADKMEGKSSEEMQLEREAADAVIRGEWIRILRCICDIVRY